MCLNTCLYNTAASKRTKLPHTQCWRHIFACQISGISWHASLHFPINRSAHQNELLPFVLQGLTSLVECKQRIVVYTKIYKNIQSISPYGIHVEPIRPSDFFQIPRDDQQRMLLNTITTRQAQTLGLEQRGSQGRAAWLSAC